MVDGLTPPPPTHIYIYPSTNHRQTPIIPQVSYAPLVEPFGFYWVNVRDVRLADQRWVGSLFLLHIQTYRHMCVYVLYIYICYHFFLNWVQQKPSAATCAWPTRGGHINQPIPPHVVNRLHESTT